MSVNNEQHRVLEYNSAADHDRQLLSLVGLTPEKLSREANSSLMMLAEMADALQLNSTTNSSYLMGLMDFQDKVRDADHQLRELEQQLASVTRANVDLLSAQSSLKQELDATSVIAAAHPDSSAKKEETLRFLHDKSREYKRQLQSLQEKLQKSNFSTDISHEAQMALAEELKCLEDETAVLNSKLSQYQGLPADIGKAQTLLQQQRLDLADLENQFSKGIASLGKSS